MDNKVNYSFNILHEEVADNDLFPDKTHERVAETVFNLIEASDKAITVGIEGSWGSGKSTVVELIRKKFASKPANGTLFFIFDAWAHEGDPLRRIFLESLIKKIDPDNKDPYLTELYEKISSRTKSVQTKCRKRASKIGRILFISTLLMPFGYAILSGVDYEKITWQWNPTYIQFLLGILFSLSPFVALGAWYIFGDKDKNGETIWDFMESESDEDYTQDITEDGERTSIEFEQYFEKILEHSIGENKSYEKAIIVVDNLDRVSTDNATTIWSTLQTFFQHRSNQTKDCSDWKKQLWFLVPFDHKGLSRTLVPSSNDDTNNKEKARSFFDKSFQIIAEVPMQVMSGWYEYCVNRVNHSLENWPKIERDMVISTFQQYVSTLHSSPTPREIHNFINKTGLIGMSWGGTMSTEAIALYSALRQEFNESELRKTLLEHDFPNNFDTIGNTNNIKMEISGILFGVDKKKGFQLLLAPEIRRSLVDGSGDKIKQYISDHGEAFWIVWKAIKHELSITDSHVEEYRIAVTEAMHNGMLEHKDKIKFEVRDLEKAWRGSVHRWDLEDHNYATALSFMASLSENREDFISWTNKTTQEITKEIVSKIDSSGTNIDQAELIQLRNISDFLKSNNTPIKPLRYDNLDEQKWGNWLNYLNDENISIPFILPKIGSIKTLSGIFLETSTTISKEILTTISETFPLLPRSLEWEEVANQLKEWATESNREINNDDAYKFMLELYSFGNKRIKSIMVDCISDELFWIQGEDEDIKISTTLPLLTACIHKEELQKNNYIGDNVKEYWKREECNNEEANSIIKALNNLKQTSTIWRLAQDKTNKLAIAIIQSQIDNTEIYDASALSSLNHYKWLLDDNKNDITYKISEHCNLTKFKDNLEKSPLEYDFFLYILADDGNKAAKNAVKLIIEKLDKNIWKESFIKNNYLLDCAIIDHVIPNHEYTVAFEDFFTNIINGTILKDDYEEWPWVHFDDLLEKTLETDRLLKRLTGIFFKTPCDLLNSIEFSALSKNIIIDTTLNDENVMDKICNWIDSNQWHRVNWLLESGYNPQSPVLETLSSRAIAYINSPTSDSDLEVCGKLIDKFKIEISAHTDEESTNENIEA